MTHHSPTDATRARRRRLTLAIGLGLAALLAGISVLSIYWYRLERRRGRNRAILIETARKLQMDPALLLAVGSVESGFDDRACSHKGAVGLLQVMPATGREVAVRLGLKSWDLYDPEDNALIGATYLKERIKRYRGDLHLALAAYNAGPGRVSTWIKAGGGLSGAETVKRHGFKSTRYYVSEVLRRAERFRKSL